MKITKKLSTLALGVALLLGVGAPISTYASCPHSPDPQYYTVYRGTYHHMGNCYVTVTDTYVKGVCHLCGAVLSDNYFSSSSKHSSCGL